MEAEKIDKLLSRLKELPEMQVWAFYNTFKLIKEMAKFKRVEGVDIWVDRVLLASAKETTRFGVNGLVDNIIGPEFYQWHQWWSLYISGLSSEKKKKLEEAIKKQDDLTSWRPDGDWRMN